MSYFHNKFNKVDRTAIYQFIKYLEDLPTVEGRNVVGAFPFGFKFGDEFRKLRQIINFAYTHGFRDDNV